MYERKAAVKFWLKQMAGIAMYFDEDPIEWQQRAKQTLEYFNEDISWLLD
jgi:hypothetical protein